MSEAITDPAKSKWTRRDVALRALGIAVMWLVIAPYKAWVIIVLWGWFITPVIAIEPPGVWGMVGLLLLVRLALGGWSTEKDDKPFVLDFAQQAIFHLLAATISLVMGTAFAGLAGLLGGAS